MGGGGSKPDVDPDAKKVKILSLTLGTPQTPNPAAVFFRRVKETQLNSTQLNELKATPEWDTPGNPVEAPAQVESDFDIRGIPFKLTQIPSSSSFTEYQSTPDAICCFVSLAAMVDAEEFSRALDHFGRIANAPAGATRPLLVLLLPKGAGDASSARAALTAKATPPVFTHAVNPDDPPNVMFIFNALIAACLDSLMASGDDRVQNLK